MTTLASNQAHFSLFLRILCGVLGFFSAWLALIPVAIYSVNVSSKLVIGGITELSILAGLGFLLCRYLPRQKILFIWYFSSLITTLFLIFTAVFINWQLSFYRISP